MGAGGKSDGLDRLVAACRDRRRAGADEDSVVAWLRTANLPLFRAIRVLMAAFGWSAGEAARRVQASPAWADHRTLWESLGDALDAAGTEGTGPGAGGAPER